MAVQLQNIKGSLNRFGWELIEARVVGDFWIAEIWLIQSTWTPVGLNVYLTFEIDGQSDARDVSRVWAAVASFKRPTDWFAEDASSDSDGKRDAVRATLSIAKESHIGPFFDGLATMRNLALSSDL